MDKLRLVCWKFRCRYDGLLVFFRVFEVKLLFSYESCDEDVSKGNRVITKNCCLSLRFGDPTRQQ